MAHLSSKQQKFIDEYLVDGNGTRAAIRAGYAERSAYVAASRMLKIAKVKAALQGRQAADATRLSITRHCVIQGLEEAIELARLAGNPAAMISGYRELAKLMGFHQKPGAFTDFESSDARVLARPVEATDAELFDYLDRHQPHTH